MAHHLGQYLTKPHHMSIHLTGASPLFFHLIYIRLWLIKYESKNLYIENLSSIIAVNTMQLSLTIWEVIKLFQSEQDVL